MASFWAGGCVLITQDKLRGIKRQWLWLFSAQIILHLEMLKKNYINIFFAKENEKYFRNIILHK
jgi:hypothetical protein